MRAVLDISFTREQVEQLFKVLADNPTAPSVSVHHRINISEIKFKDEYTVLVSGTELCSTTAIVRCK